MAQPADSSTVESVLAGRTDLDKYRHNKRLLFAAELILGLDDIHAVAATSLTDGPGDRSCDFVHLDRASGLIVLAQAYEATGRTTVRQAKARDLYQAVGRVFSQDTAGLPAGLTSAIQEVRSAIQDGVVRKIEIWFVHNLEPQNDLAEILTGAEGAARDALARHFAEVASEIEVTAEELSGPVLAERFRSFETPILVSETIRVPAQNFFVETGPGWTAYLTSVPMEWLKEQFWAHEDRLFSGNVRGYLGRSASPGNINNGIRETLRDEPANFWIYNNGVTALVTDVAPVEGLEPGTSDLEIKGLSIVNGAQTTGALHKSAQLGELADAKVMVRFIRCADPAIVKKIIRFNNRQNVTMPADFRTNEPVQRRLVAEFAGLGVFGYTGGRRGSTDDRIRRSPAEHVTTEFAAQALVAFHGDPALAYHAPGRIWSDSAVFRKHFNDATSARHLLLCWGLAKAVDERRREVAALPETPGTKEVLGYLHLPGSMPLLVAAVAGCLDSLLDGPPSDLFRLKARGGADDAIALWRPVVADVGPWLERLSPVLISRELRDAEKVRVVVDGFKAAVARPLSHKDAVRAAFAEQVEVSRS